MLITVTACVFSASPADAQGLSAIDRIEDDEEGADVLGAFAGSVRMLLVEHGTRIALQEKTRRELGGNFWLDYHRSVRMPGQWGDTDGWLVNYLGHPIHGAAAGYIWLDNERNAPVEFRPSRGYWTTRGRAMAWSAFYSLQFEIGPFSEASIGNVGLRPETTGWVDHVVTPTGGIGLIVLEDVVDRWFIKRIETRTSNRLVRTIVRMALNPGRTMSNASIGKAPWHREGRTLGWR